MAKRYKRTKTSMLQAIASEYMAMYGVDHCDPDELADWAIETGRWQDRPYDAHKRCRREIVDAMRLMHFEDPQGRSVRQMHPVRVKKGENYVFEWYKIFELPPDKFKASVALRRDGVLATLKQMKTDQDSWNDNNTCGATLPLFVADFSADMEEMDQPEDSWPDEDPESGDKQGHDDADPVK